MQDCKPMQNSAFPVSSPKTAEELVQEAKELLTQQKPEEACKCFEASLALKPTAPAYRGLGNIRFMLRDPQGAIPFFQQALKADPQDHASNAMLAEAHFA